jgi:predicted lactoylglutathione lyase
MTEIFVNLAVKDLGKSMDFFKALGYSFNEQFTDENAGCLVISDTIYAMLLTETFFKTFTKKNIIDAKNNIEVITAISAESKQQVDQIVDKALSSGGSPANDPTDYGWMYSRSFQDPDGHVWEYVYMDMSKMPTS